jgi:hypothetical protein
MLWPEAEILEEMIDLLACHFVRPIIYAFHHYVIWSSAIAVLFQHRGTAAGACSFARARARKCGKSEKITNF